jgi:hypothetical protein
MNDAIGELLTRRASAARIERDEEVASLVLGQGQTRGEDDEGAEEQPSGG